MANDALPVDDVARYLRGLHDELTAAIEAADGAGRFRRDTWRRAEGGGGETRVLRDGAVFEQAGINFSHVRGGTASRLRHGAAPRARGRVLRSDGRVACCPSSQSSRADLTRQRAFHRRDDRRASQRRGGSAAVST